MVKETIEESSYERNLAAIREERARMIKKLYYIAHREKMLAYSKEYKKSYHLSEVQKQRYNLKQKVRYRTDPLFRQKALDRAKHNRKKGNVVRIVNILNGIIKSKEKV